MGRITFRLPADGPHDVFAPDALDALVGTITTFNGHAATIVAVRVLEDARYGEVTVESDLIGPGNAEATLPAGSFVFRTLDEE